MLKKIKPVISSDPSRGASVPDTASVRLKHRFLLEDFSALQEEAESRRRKLERAKETRATLANEVRFLKKRYKYLMTSETPEPLFARKVEPMLTGEEEFVVKRRTGPVERKKRNNSNDKKGRRPPSKQSNCRRDGAGALVKRTPSLKEPIELAQKVLNFDLNEISRDDEEPMIPCGRGGDEGGRKLNSCLITDSGSNREGKRKISWQEPVAVAF